jgi:hypothetical protein
LRQFDDDTREIPGSLWIWNFLLQSLNIYNINDKQLWMWLGKLRIEQWFWWGLIERFFIVLDF